MTKGPLEGRRILITAYDLEQNEHRGIAVYSKSIIKALKKAGADVWILTEFFDKTGGRRLNRLNKETKKLVKNARILNKLARGKEADPMTVLQRKFKLARNAKKIKIYFNLLINLLRRPRAYRTRNLYSFKIQKLFDNPYIRIERLNYLEDVTGIISAPEIYLSSQLAAQLKNLRPVHIDLQGFDALITTCPLNIRPYNLPIFVQTIHDLIPLEYVAHNEEPLMFSHRLESCIPARKLFVSQSTSKKFKDHIQNVKKKSYKSMDDSVEASREAVIVQTPSMEFPSWLTEDDERIADLKPVSHLLWKESEINTNKSKQISQGMKNREKVAPFQYFLFNSSVEARKNLLFLAKAYAESDLNRRGIKLCVTGKLKGDDYSKALKDIVDKEPGIILTGYIDESSKLDLYLNALALLSPSLVEGFGIPVLDGACLGLPTVASNCESHLEIQSLYDFSNHVICLNTLNSRDWATAMQAIAGKNRNLERRKEVERKKRIKRYCDYQSRITKKLEEDIISIIK